MNQLEFIKLQMKAKALAEENKLGESVHTPGESLDEKSVDELNQLKWLGFVETVRFINQVRELRKNVLEQLTNNHASLANETQRSMIAEVAALSKILLLIQCQE